MDYGQFIATETGVKPTVACKPFWIGMFASTASTAVTAVSITGATVAAPLLVPVAALSAFSAVMSLGWAEYPGSHIQNVR